MSLTDAGKEIPQSTEVGYCKPPVHTRWKPGQSGNPGGRPKKLEKAVDVAVDNVEAAMALAVKHMSDEDARISLAAVQLIIDRAMGKPKQTVETKDTTDVREMDERELLAIARQRSCSEGDDTPSTGPAKSN